MKDLYDIHFLTKMNKKINYDHVNQAISNTLDQRKMAIPEAAYSSILHSLSQSEYQRVQWNKFQVENVYATSIPFKEIMESVMNFSEHVVTAGQLTLENRISKAKEQARIQNKNLKNNREDHDIIK